MKRSKFIRSAHDPCVYFNNSLYLKLYVDDILIVGKNKKEIAHIKSMLKLEFEMTDLGEAKKILGIEIRRNRP